MKHDFAAAMGRALERTRAGNPAEATRLIQAALAGSPTSADGGRVLSRETAAPEPGDGPDAGAGGSRKPPADVRGRDRGGRRSLRAVVEALRGGARPAVDPGVRDLAPPAHPPEARWEIRTFSCAAGARSYALYVPAAARPAGVVLMLHGCTQTAADCARGTRMNELAERHGLIVAYPEQTRSHNAQSCWNWFRPGDQSAGRGEPEILAGIAREICGEFAIPPGRCFAAGLSAGGAMAAILGASHPEVFSAVGVHSGLPRGAAHDVVSAFAAMRGEGGSPPPDRRPARTIVFHGSADRTVHPSNGERVVQAVTAQARLSVARENGRSRDGRAFTRTSFKDAAGVAVCEHWLVQGAGHAWLGGSPDGSYTDPDGPDASAEMVRFFLAGPGGAA